MVNVMSPVIRIPENIYSRLEQHAKEFNTPENVIETLLDYFEGLDTKALNMSPSSVAVKKKDTTKYLFKKHQYSKRGLVLAAIKDFVSHDPNTTFENLEKNSQNTFKGQSECLMNLNLFKGNMKTYLMKDIL